MADQLALEFGSVELVKTHKGKGGRASVRRVAPVPGPNFGVDSEPSQGTAELPALPALPHWLHNDQRWRLRESDNVWICAVCHPDAEERREQWSIRV